MEHSSETVITRIHEIYCAKGLKKESKNLLGFRSSKTIQNLEEIGRDELFKYNLLNSCKEFGHNGIVTRPGKKATVLVIGNHSAGKSSFVNWYIGEKVQSTGVAVETSHFTMISYGEKTNELKSEGTLNMYPFLREIMNRNEKAVYGTFFANLNTRFSSSKNNLFQFVDFIDTPGLTDGNIKYNCDIIEMMKWVSNYVDLVLVFLDPIGQALCSKTMEMIEFLSENYADKLKICLSKIDQIDDQAEFTKLCMQIFSVISMRTQQLNVDIIPFTIMKDSKNSNNKIQLVIEAIEKAKLSKVLSNIETLSNDCNFILSHVDSLRYINSIAITKNRQKMVILSLLFIALVLLGLVIFHEYYYELTFIYYTERLILLSFCLISLIVVISINKQKLLTSNQLSRLVNWEYYCKLTIEETQQMTNAYFSN